MGGIGVTFESTEDGRTSQEQSTPVTNLPPNVVEAVARALGIQTDQTKAALRDGTLNLPDDVEVKITRKITDETLTLKKRRGGAEYELKYKGETTTIPGYGAR
jgi:hypothetical protein